MKQTELMLRLLKDGKIVGYEKHNNGGIAHSKSCKKDFLPIFAIPEHPHGKNILCHTFPCFINHDSFEQGIKVGDEWWFEGDIIQRPIPKIPLIIRYCGRFGWNLYRINEEDTDFIWFNDDSYKRIGNIHEEITGKDRRTNV